VTTLLVGCGAFLLAVLWMDLTFDVQAWRLGSADETAGAAALTSIAAYYRRVTTDALPMGRLIAVVMLVQLGAIADEVLLRPLTHGWRALAVVVLGAGPIALALARIVPDAVRLGARRDPPATQAALARRILWAHLACFAAIAAFVVLPARLR
jgi:hypothetical protein